MLFSLSKNAFTCASARVTPRFWQISTANGRLALPLKILMRSGFIARIGFGAAIDSDLCVRAAVDATRRDNAPGLRTEWEKLAPPLSARWREQFVHPLQRVQKPRSRFRSSSRVWRPVATGAVSALSTEGAARRRLFRNR